MRYKKIFFEIKHPGAIIDLNKTIWARSFKRHLRTQSLIGIGNPAVPRA